MTQRSRRYQASPTIARQPRVEPLRGPVINWRAVRQYIMPLTLLGVAVVLYLMQSSFATTSELDIASLAKQREVILHHNAQLSAEIAELEKPARIRERAFALGLVDMTTSVRLAVPQVAPDPDVPTGGIVNSDDETFWQHLAGDVVNWFTTTIH
jgi:hypothetical protein